MCVILSLPENRQRLRYNITDILFLPYMNGIWLQKGIMFRGFCCTE